MLKIKPNKLGYTIIVIMLIIAGIIAFRKRRKLKIIAMKTINYIKEKTWDFHTDRRINSLHPLIREKAKEFVIRAEKELGVKLRVTSGLRTWNEQNKLYAKGRTTSGKVVTNARGGQSLHNFGLAIDVVEIKNGKALWTNSKMSEIAALGKSNSFFIK